MRPAGSLFIIVEKKRHDKSMAKAKLGSVNNAIFSALENGKDILISRVAENVVEYHVHY